MTCFYKQFNEIVVMRKVRIQLLFAGLCISALFSCCTEKEKPMTEIIEAALLQAEKQSLLMAARYDTVPGVLPRSFENGQMITAGSRWWTSGFFPGVLWLLYENSRNPDLLRYAREYTARVEREQYTTDNHDVGFMLYCSFGNGLRITGDTAYKAVLLQGAKSLSSRFNPQPGLIRSWDSNPNVWQYAVIIDNMMNLELLMWAGKNSGDTTFAHIARSHADKTQEQHFRADNSSYHVVSYDTVTGSPHIKQTHQGYADNSAWARGQAWGLYGYTMMYRETRNIRYLQQAEKIAAFLLHHPNMPADGVPYWDFNAPGIPSAPRDASAAAIMASALIELSAYAGNDKQKQYLAMAEKQLRTLSSPEYLAGVGDNGYFILKHSVGSLPHHSEIDVPLTYADYYYLEALMRWKSLISSEKILPLPPHQ
jgi:hypothetical protein